LCAQEQGLLGVEGAAQVSRRFEHEFLRDMAAMNVLPPDAITRVTDYLPDIVQFVSDLEAKGFAYRGARTGSLWHNAQKFSR
jgi:cysteinyl-tRNA synthetase